MQRSDQSFDIVLGRLQIGVKRIVNLFNIEQLSHHAVVDIEHGGGVLNFPREALHKEQNTSRLEYQLDEVVASVVCFNLSWGLRELDRYQEVLNLTNYRGVREFVSVGCQNRVVVEIPRILIQPGNNGVVLKYQGLFLQTVGQKLVL